MKEIRALIQRKNENGEFETIQTYQDVVGIIFNGNKAEFMITGTDNQMAQASGALLGYIMGKNEKKVIEMGDNNA